MRWPRAWASRRSAKVESPAMRMRSIGSICTAMARGMGDPVGRVSRFPAYTRTARDGEAALTSSASRRMQSRVERERLLKIQAIEACGLERVENQVPTMGRNRARNRHEAMATKKIVAEGLLARAHSVGAASRLTTWHMNKEFE